MSAEQKQYPRAGLAVWIQNAQEEFLMMQRLGSHGGGTWAPPGGKLEMGESFFNCCQRETKEEADLNITGTEFIGVTNDPSAPTVHYVTLHFRAKAWSGKAKVMEPEKCSQIDWYNIHNLPKPLFWTVEHLLESDFPCLCGSGKSFKSCPKQKSD